MPAADWLNRIRPSSITPTSLRVQRSNPERRPLSVDCLAALVTIMARSGCAGYRAVGHERHPLLRVVKDQARGRRGRIAVAVPFGQLDDVQPA